MGVAARGRSDTVDLVTGAGSSSMTSIFEGDVLSTRGVDATRLGSGSGSSSGSGSGSGLGVTTGLGRGLGVEATRGVDFFTGAGAASGLAGSGFSAAGFAVSALACCVESTGSCGTTVSGFGCSTAGAGVGFLAIFCCEKVTYPKYPPPASTMRTTSPIRSGARDFFFGISSKSSSNRSRLALSNDEAFFSSVASNCSRSSSRAAGCCLVAEGISSTDGIRRVSAPVLSGAGFGGGGGV